MDVYPFFKTAIFIQSDVISKKNHKDIRYSTRYIKKRGAVATVPYIGNSEGYIQWTKNTAYQFAAGKHPFIAAIKNRPLPLLVGFHFVRATAQPFDFNNMSQGPLDEMQRAEWIAKDDIFNVLPIPVPNPEGKYITIDPRNPGVYIGLITNLNLEF